MWAAALLVILGLLAVGLASALPSALPRLLAWGSERYLGAPARVASAELDLLAGEFTLFGVVMGAPGERWPPHPEEASDAWLRADRLALQLSWSDLRERRLRLRRVVVDGPELKLARAADGAIGPRGPAAAAPAGADPKPDPAEPEADPERENAWEIVLDVLELRGPGLAITDEAAPEPELLRVAAAGLRLSGVRLAGETVALAGIELEAPVVHLHPDLVGAGPGDPPAPGEPEPSAAGESDTEPDQPSEAPDGGTTAETDRSPETPVQRAPAESEDPPPGLLAGTRIERLQVEAAQLLWLGPGGPLDLRVTLEAEDVRADPGRSFPVRLAVGVDEGEIEARGELALDPLGFAGTLRWQRVPVPFVLASAAPDLLPWLHASDLGGEVELRVGPDGEAYAPAMALHASGRLSLAEFAFADPEERELVVALDALDVELRSLRVPFGQVRAPEAPGDGPEGAATAPRRVTEIELGRVTAERPRVLYARPTPALDALRAGPDPEASEEPGDEEPLPVEAAPQEVPPPEEPTPAAPGYALAIASLELSGGRLQLRDAETEPPFDIALTSVELEAEGVRLPEAHAEQLRLRAVAPDGAPVRLEGSWGAERAQGSLAVERLALAPFDAYAARATGYRPRGGDASLTVEGQREGQRVTLSSQLVFHGLHAAAVDPGLFARRFGISLDLALAMLRDRRGDVTLRVPVAFDAGRARVDPAAIVTNALRQSLTATLNAPLRLLGTFVPADPRAPASQIELMLVSAPGSEEARADPPPFPALARLLAQRPGLGLVVYGRAGPEDREALAEAMEVDPDQVPDAELAALAERRAERALAEARAAGVDEQRVRAAAPRVPGPPGVLLELVARGS